MVHFVTKTSVNYEVWMQRDEESDRGPAGWNVSRIPGIYPTYPPGEECIGSVSEEEGDWSNHLFITFKRTNRVR